MNPTAFSINGFEIRWYGILIWLGIVAALALGYYNCKRKNLSFDTVFDGLLVCLPAAIVGARFYYVIFQFNEFKDNPISMFNTRTGGLAIHGGLIGAAIAAAIFFKVKKIKPFEYLDLVAPSIVLAQAIGRWGNFMNSEAHGGEVTKEFISHFPEFIQKGMLIGGKYYHPTFLYESIWDILCCVILMIIFYKNKEGSDGVVIGSYMILYSVGRFFIEGLRTDSLMFGGLRVAQITSIALIIAGIIVIYLTKKKRITKITS